MRFLAGKEKKAGDEFITIINPESLLWFKEHIGLDGYDMIIYDEVHYFKNPGTSRFTGWRSQMPKVTFIYAATGSPTAASNGYVELWGQVYCVDQGATLLTTKTQYLNTYFDQNPYQTWKITPKPGAEMAIMQKLKNVSNALDNDPGELPQLTHNISAIHLDDDARRQYTEMQKYSMIKGTDVVAVNSAVRSHKLKQIAAGQAYDFNKNVVPIHNEKAKRLLQLVESLQGDPLIIFYEFHHDRDVILHTLGRHYRGIPVIEQGVDPDDIVDIMREWNAGKLPLLLGQARKAGVGGNFQAVCANVCFYTLPWSLETVEQCIGRVWRMGQKRDVVVHYLCAANTKDMDIVQRVNDKKQLQDQLFKELA